MTNQHARSQQHGNNDNGISTFFATADAGGTMMYYATKLVLFRAYFFPVPSSAVTPSLSMLKEASQWEADLLTFTMENRTGEGLK